MRTGILIAFIIALLKCVYGESTPLCEKESQCHQIGQQEMISVLRSTTKPDPEEALKKLCPSFKGFLYCQLMFLSLCSNHESEYAEMSRVNNVTFEICDKGSRLHKAFVRNIECLLPLLFGRQFRTCGDDARAAAGRYATYRDFKEYEINRGLFAELQCLRLHLNDQCTRSIADEKCGREAGETFQEIYHRMEDFCTEEEMSDINARYQKMMNDEPTMARLSEIMLNHVSEQEDSN